MVSGGLGRWLKRFCNYLSDISEEALLEAGGVSTEGTLVQGECQKLGINMEDADVKKNRVNG